MDICMNDRNRTKCSEQCANTAEAILFLGMNFLIAEICSFKVFHFQLRLSTYFVMMII